MIRFLIVITTVTLLSGCAGFQTYPQYTVTRPASFSEAKANFDSTICGDDAAVYYGCMESLGYTLTCSSGTCMTK